MKTRQIKRVYKKAKRIIKHYTLKAFDEDYRYYCKQITAYDNTIKQLKSLTWDNDVDEDFLKWLSYAKPFGEYVYFAGKGWRNIISTLFVYATVSNREYLNSLSGENNAHNHHPEVLLHENFQPVIICQVKEKFGTLNIYYMTSFKDNDFIHNFDNVVRMLQRRSARVCEFCGSEKDVKRVTKNGWIKTLCKKCATKNNYEQC